MLLRENFMAAGLDKNGYARAVSAGNGAYEASSRSRPNWHVWPIEEPMEELPGAHGALPGKWRDELGRSDGSREKKRLEPWSRAVGSTPDETASSRARVYSRPHAHRAVRAVRPSVFRPPRLNSPREAVSDMPVRGGRAGILAAVRSRPPLKPLDRPLRPHMSGRDRR